MKIAIGSDHAGFKLKSAAIELLKNNGYEVEDFGTHSEDSCDYPDYALLVSEAVASKKADKGILVCGTGIGMCIAANKVKGIRCALCHDTFSARLTRLHNDANVLAMGARVIGEGLALDIIKTFLDTDTFEGGKHLRRIGKIAQIEEKNN